MDLSAVRALERTPKDAVERYFASHALMALPTLRLSDVEGSFLDDLIDSMEEIEVCYLNIETVHYLACVTCNRVRVRHFLLLTRLSHFNFPFSSHSSVEFSFAMPCYWVPYSARQGLF